MKTYKGILLAEGLKFSIVVARFNEFITSKLLAGAIDALERHGVPKANIELAWIPGAFEISVVTKKW
ncbi:dimethyl-8-ribityllumazine synthase 6-7 [Sporomusaceae bacterium BoRhaA]|nr:6,7-dimethyl-8-ribityllumazine synthase [Pelorhabdus rhamnosifermentans]MBU2703508.1 dimethyl-8-ribityllumazine synthase 6-7 [Pelorhabdus rhamnosifermentans]